MVPCVSPSKEEKRELAWRLADAYVADYRTHVIEDHKDPMGNGPMHTPVRLISGAIRCRDLPGLLNRIDEIEPSLEEAHQVRFVRQVAAFFKKNVDFADDERCTAAAIAGFKTAENRCKITNKRLDWYELYPDRLDPELRDQLALMRQSIAEICGEPDEWLQRIPELIRFTSGATSVTPRPQSKPFMKVKNYAYCTPGAGPYVEAASQLIAGTRPKLRLTWANRIAFVLKNWKTHRTIAAEPPGNLPFQLSLDVFWKERLLQVCGIDLGSQERNREGARIASLDGNSATVDLEMASGTIALNVPLAYFPERWVQHLMALRSPGYKSEFGSGLYQSFSSMGNGYTFTLETILFVSACRAVGSVSPIVYGDDIIIESHLYDRLVRLLRFLGLRVNLRKSFNTGSFRESCGFDAFKGTLVTPFHLRGYPKDQAEWAHLCNGLFAICVPPLGASYEGVWLSARFNLANFAKGVVNILELLLVPYNGSTTSGVHLHPSDARSMGVLRVNLFAQKWIPVFKGYVPRVSTLDAGNLKGLMLWHFNVRNRDISESVGLPLPYDDPTGSTWGGWRTAEAEITSVVTEERAYNTSSYVSWFIPPGDIPTQLYWVLEFLRAPAAGTLSVGLRKVLPRISTWEPSEEMVLADPWQTVRCKEQRRRVVLGY